MGELSDGRYATLAIDEDYEIRFGTGADLAPISRASGGEEDLLNLCLRLAISELIIESTGVGRWTRRTISPEAATRAARMVVPPRSTPMTSCSVTPDG